MDMTHRLLGVQEYLSRNTQAFPHKSNWASLLGSRCLRQLVYYRTDWNKIPNVSVELAGIFETGKFLEPHIIHIYNQIALDTHQAWRLSNTGKSISDKTLDDAQIGAATDSFVLCFYPGDGQGIKGQWKREGVLEIKTLNPNIIARIHTIDDFENFPWMMKYIAQLQTYTLGLGYERGFFLLVNKANLFDHRWIEVPLDYQYAENLLQKAHAVNEHVAAGTLPDKINRPDECSRCPFNSICMPEVVSDGTCKIVVDDELEQILRDREEYAAAHKMYEAADKALGNRLVKGQDIICGSFSISWKEITVNYKAKPASTMTQYRKKIVNTAVPDENEDTDD